MARKLRVTVYPGASNPISLYFGGRSRTTGEFTPEDFTATARVVATIVTATGLITIDSDVPAEAGCFDYSDSLNEGKLVLHLAGLSTLPGPGYYDFRVQHYDSSGDPPKILSHETMPEARLELEVARTA